MKLLTALEINKALLEAQEFEKTLERGFSRKLAYNISKNKNKLKPIVKAFQEAIKPSEEYTKYDMERVELAKKHAKKDKDGNPVISSFEYVLEDKEAFEKELETLREKFKEAVEEHKKKAEESETLLDNDEEVELVKLKIQDFPDNFPSSIFEGLETIIENEQ